MLQLLLGRFVASSVTPSTYKAGTHDRFAEQCFEDNPAFACSGAEAAVTEVAHLDHLAATSHKL